MHLIYIVEWNFKKKVHQRRENKQNVYDEECKEFTLTKWTRLQRDYIQIIIKQL